MKTFSSFLNGPDPCLLAPWYLGQSQVAKCASVHSSAALQSRSRAQELKCVIVVTINCEPDIPLHIGLL